MKIPSNIRNSDYPITKNSIFMGHAGVSPLPKCVINSMSSYLEKSSLQMQEFSEVLITIQKTRKISAKIISAHEDEIALLGPTSLGLSLFANGLDWKKGDEIICYKDDYPANVYPWQALEKKGVKIRYLKPEIPGDINLDLLKKYINKKTKLCALASCHYLTGIRIDIDKIGKFLHENNILFCLDAIQTIGAFDTSTKYVDFLSADAHKWMLGPMAIGIIYVKKENFSILEPTLLGAWNVQSPNFITQDKINFPDTAQRYEPGVLNAVGIYGMKSALELLLSLKIENISNYLLELHTHMLDKFTEIGFEPIIDYSKNNLLKSAIFTCSHPKINLSKMHKHLEDKNINISLRHNRQGKEFFRLSPHFYNTKQEIDTIVTEISNASISS